MTWHNAGGLHKLMRYAFFKDKETDMAANLLEHLQDLNPHQYEDDTVKIWVAELEKMIEEYITSAYDIEPEEDTGLMIIGEPSLYIEFLSQKIDMANGEYERANNHAAMFNALFTDWKERFFRQHKDQLKTNPQYIKVM